MQHQPRLAAEQPGRVDAQRQFAADALFRIVGNQLSASPSFHRFFIRLRPLCVFDVAVNRNAATP